MAQTQLPVPGRVALFAVFVAFAVHAAGCGFTQSPRLEVVGVSLAEESEEAMVLVFAIDAENRNEIALPLRNVRYSAVLDGHSGVRTERSGEATLRRLGTQRIFLPVVIPLDPERGRPTGVVEYRLRGRMWYVTPGALAEALFDAGVRRPSKGFAKTGAIDLGEGPGDPPSLVTR